VGRFLAVLLFIIGVTLPALAEDPPDCSAWTLKGIRPGMTLTEARAIRDQWEKGSHPKDPPGYARFEWRAKDRAEKIDLHADMRAVPPRVIGVGTTVPSSETNGKEYLAGLLEKWGKPVSVSKQGAFNLYTWTSAECDVDVRVSVMNVEHQIAVQMAMASISGRWEYVQRERATRGGTTPAEPEGGVDAVEDAPE
jgi:hypothetical protein